MSKNRQTKLTITKVSKPLSFAGSQFQIQQKKLQLAVLRSNEPFRFFLHTDDHVGEGERKVDFWERVLRWSDCTCSSDGKVHIQRGQGVNHSVAVRLRLL